MFMYQTRVFVAENVTARDPRYFLEPEKFHPERWLPKDHPLYDSRFEDDVKDASKPFLMGPRACLGMHLAYLEMRYVLLYSSFLDECLSLCTGWSFPIWCGNLTGRWVMKAWTLIKIRSYSDCGVQHHCPSHTSPSTNNEHPNGSSRYKSYALSSA